ncbi:MAG: hypothetical protein V4524_01260 [Patescibacteria group bacterium]
MLARTAPTNGHRSDLTFPDDTAVRLPIVIEEPKPDRYTPAPSTIVDITIVERENMLIEYYTPARYGAKKTGTPVLIIHPGDLRGKWTMDKVCKDLTGRGYRCCVITPKGNPSMSRQIEDFGQFIKLLEHDFILIGYGSGSIVCNQVGWKHRKRIKGYCSLLAAPCNLQLQLTAHIGFNPLFKLLYRRFRSIFLYRLPCTQLVIVSKKSEHYSYQKLTRRRLGGTCFARRAHVTTLQDFMSDPRWQLVPNRIAAWLAVKFS